MNDQIIELTKSELKNGYFPLGEVVVSDLIIH